MPLAIETGAPLAGANTFVDGAYLIAYYADVGVTIEPTKAESLLIKAFRFMTPLPWKISHATEFVVTDSMKKAQCEIAYAYSQGFNPNSIKDSTEVIEQSVKAGSVATTEKFSSNNISDIERVPSAYLLLKPLLNNGNDIGFMLQR